MRYKEIALDGPLLHCLRGRGIGGDDNNVLPTGGLIAVRGVIVEDHSCESFAAVFAAN
jgi:hypothetical protein